MFSIMVRRGKVERRSDDLFKRLANHGVPLHDYGTIKKIVAFDLPKSRLFFLDRFGRRTIARVMEQIELWKVLFKRDFILFPDQKAELEKWIYQAESLAWQALIQANLPRVGPWRLELSLVPTGQGYSGPRYIYPGQRITAFKDKTHETREALIPAEEFNDPVRFGSAYRKAFKTLGIWDLLWKGSPGHRLMSARKRQAWPIFTKNVIPRLYEYLIPYYEKPGNYSERIDSPGHRRPARFPGELLRDMLEILRMEHPHVFRQTPVANLKAVLQNYLAQKDKSIKSGLKA